MKVSAIPPEVRAMLARKGATILRVRQNKHAVISVRSAEGHEFNLVCSVSSSDVRALRNIEATYDRLSRAQSLRGTSE